MKISEKQLLKLITIAINYGSSYATIDEAKKEVSNLIFEINSQQSEELKEVE